MCFPGDTAPPAGYKNVLQLLPASTRFLWINSIRHIFHITDDITYSIFQMTFSYSLSFKIQGMISSVNSLSQKGWEKEIGNGAW